MRCHLPLQDTSAHLNDRFYVNAGLHVCWDAEDEAEADDPVSFVIGSPLKHGFEVLSGSFS